MRYGPDHKSKSRQSILKLAGARLKRDGFSGVGIDGLASAAGVTSGAFYSNFPGKEEFLKEMIHEFLGETLKISGAEDAKERKEIFKMFLQSYLDIEHCMNPEEGCVMPTLSADVSRASKAVRTVYQKKMLVLVDKISKVILGTPAQKRKKAWIAISLLIGSVTVARALPDRLEREQVLGAALDSALALIETN